MTNGFLETSQKNKVNFEAKQVQAFRGLEFNTIGKSLGFTLRFPNSLET